MKYKVTLPVQFDGPRYGMSFYKGVGITDNKAYADRLEQKGFIVEEVEDEYKIMSIKGREIGTGISPGVPPIEGTEEDVEENPFESMSINQLKKYAEENEIDISTASPNDKATIIRIIQASIDEWEDSEE